MTPSSFEQGNEQTGKINVVQVLLNILLVLAVAAALLGWPGCSSRSQEGEIDPQLAEIQQKRQERQDAIRAQNEEPPLPKPEAPNKTWIKRAYFTPNRIQSGTQLKIRVETAEPPEDSEIVFVYSYWKNGSQMQEYKGDTLPPTAYKKGDLVYADVEFYINGQLSEKARSEVVEIANSSPVIEEVQIPQISGPGAYSIALKCKDIDEDQIKYSLLPAKEGGDVWPGLSIDSASGNVTLTLGDTAPPKLLKFVISADDGDGGITKKIVSINFQINQPPPKPKEGEDEKGESDGPQ